MRSVFTLIIGLVLFGAFAQSIEEVDFSELSKTLHQNFVEDFDYSVLVDINGNVVYAEDFGYTDKKRSIPVDPSTRFNIASITKSITAVGIMKLLEQNKIRLSDTLGVFFASVPKSKASISIQALLSHRSGLPQTYPLDGISESSKAAEIIWDEELEFSPGSSFRYSNQNYQLLALIIEKVAKTSFEDFIRENILVPLEMHTTRFWDEMDEAQNMAPLPKRISRNLGARNWGWLGSGGIFSTPGDLYKFWKGINNDKFLSKESRALVFGNYYQTTSGLQIGFGFFTSPNTQWNTSLLWTRGTESWGHNAVIQHFPDKNVTIIVTTNSGEIDNDQSKTGNRLISDLIANYLFD